MEKTELFCRSIGDATDIVEKEMYSFIDKGDNGVTLRPEGTAGVMRAFIEHKLYAQDPVAKLYYLGPMFRYERPQKGRYRQFHQIGAEITGVHDPLADAQVLNMLVQFFREIGLDEPQLQINSLGCPECRPAYRAALMEFLEQRVDWISSARTAGGASAPTRCGPWTARCRAASRPPPERRRCWIISAAAVTTTLPASGAIWTLTGTPYSINPRMVRGLDYYTRTTFEMVTGLLGSQSAVAAGGRYDGLISQLGGPAIPGIGFAMGVERVALLLGEKDSHYSRTCSSPPWGQVSGPLPSG